MNRPLSMTAFGRGESRHGNTTWTAEVRSVNHRFRDIKVRIPRKYGALEERIKRLVMAHYSRGHVDVFIEITGPESGSTRLRPNLALAREYQHCLEEIGRELSLAAPADLGLIADFKDIIIAEEEDEDLEEIWTAVGAALNAALENGLAMREREGASLKKDLLLRLNDFSNNVESIAAAAPQLLAERKQALRERLDRLLDGIDADPLRLAQEMAIMADKSDVTEELVRLKSHIDQFTRFLSLNEPVGRRLDFLLQEFLREINTLASKISNAQVAHQTVDLKNEVEKLREQVQNIE